MTKLTIDFETFSEVDLPVVGLRNYVTHPSTGVYCLSLILADEGGPRSETCIPVAVPGNSAKNYSRSKPLPPAVLDHVMAERAVYSFNAGFELEVWNRVCVPRYGFPELKLDQMYCVQAQAYTCGLPGSLAFCAMALRQNYQKDREGHALMLRMCKPDSEGVWLVDKPEFTFLGASMTPPQALARLEQYCLQDTRTAESISRLLPPLNRKERAYFLHDMQINTRGMPVDTVFAERAAHLRENILASLDAELALLTKGEVTECSKVAQIKAYLKKETGLSLASLNKPSVASLLADPAIDSWIKNILLCRQEAGKATSTSKYSAIVAQGYAERLYHQVQYHGAITGRAAGRGVQPHNFPRKMPPEAEVDRIRDIVCGQTPEDLSLFFTSALSVLSASLRATIRAPEKKSLVAGDFSNIEGRALAWLAGEEWKLDTFRAFDDGTGPDVYSATYARSFNVPVEGVTENQRQIGKTQELALGYGGSVGAFTSMASTFGISLPEETVTGLVKLWRKAHPKIHSYWYGLEISAISALKNRGKAFSIGPAKRQVRYRYEGSFLICQLPSGRNIYYPYPKLLGNTRRPQITYMAVPTPTAKAKIIEDPYNQPYFSRIDTYGGKLAENVTQAICFDLLAEAMLRLEKVGFPVSMHIHDEIICEISGTQRSISYAPAHFKSILNEAPPWAEGLPIESKCWMNQRYAKS